MDRPDTTRMKTDSTRDDEAAVDRSAGYVTRSELLDGVGPNRSVRERERPESRADR